MLKNSGCDPDELRLVAEIRSAERLLVQARGQEERVAASARLRLLLERMGSSRALPVKVQADYFERLVDRLGRAGGGNAYPVPALEASFLNPGNTVADSALISMRFLCSEN